MRVHIPPLNKYQACSRGLHEITFHYFRLATLSAGYLGEVQQVLLSSVSWSRSIDESRPREVFPMPTLSLLFFLSVSRQSVEMNVRAKVDM